VLAHGSCFTLFCNSGNFRYWQWDSKAAQTPFFKGSAFLTWDLQKNSFIKALCEVLSSCQKTFNSFLHSYFHSPGPILSTLQQSIDVPYREIAPIGLAINISFLIKGCESIIGGYQYDVRQDLTFKGTFTLVDNIRNNLAIYNLRSHVTSLFHT